MGKQVVVVTTGPNLNKEGEWVGTGLDGVVGRLYVQIFRLEVP